MELFLYKGQSLFFKTWINSGILYLKDIIGDDGKLIDIKDFSNILENKSNWLCEYGIIRYTLQPFIKNITYQMRDPQTYMIILHFSSTQNLAT